MPTGHEGLNELFLEMCRMGIEEERLQEEIVERIGKIENMNSREDLLKLIFPEPYESHYAEGQFNSCFSDFAQCFLLSCCLENGKKSKKIHHASSKCFHPNA